MKPFLSCVSLCVALVAGHADAKIVRHSNHVKGEYIVGLVQRSPSAIPGLARSIASSYKGELTAIFTDILGGFAIRLSSDAAERLADDPRVRLVEENPILTVVNSDVSARISTTVNGADLWHLDRIDDASWNTAVGTRDHTYEYCSPGSGVNIYVLDLPIDAAHVELNSQVVAQVDFTQSINYQPRCDSHAIGWHGTAVASVAAGKTIGVAPGSKIVGLSILDCVRTTSARAYVGALNWIAAATPQFSAYGGYATNPYRSEPGVISFSGFQQQQTSIYDGTQAAWYPSVEIATKEVVDRTGFPFVTSANNFSANAAAYTPSNLGLNGSGATGERTNNVLEYVPPTVLTVGGTMMVNGVDYRWQEYDSYGMPLAGQDSGSNSGPPISIWAPAKNIYVALHGGFNGSGATNLYGLSSGTSFAAPIVAGLAARYIQLHGKQNAGARPSASTVYAYLMNNSRPLVHGTTTPSGASSSTIGLAYMHETVNETGGCRIRATQ